MKRRWSRVEKETQREKLKKERAGKREREREMVKLRK